MMKNTEWGAVSYLAESKYGRNGTAWEYVAGVLDSKLSNGSNYNFTGINSKYYNVYASYNESKKVKGDGVYETSTTGSGSMSWHQDYSNFVNSSNPVFIRYIYYIV